MRKLAKNITHVKFQILKPKILKIYTCLGFLENNLKPKTIIYIIQDFLILVKSIRACLGFLGHFPLNIALFCFFVFFLIHYFSLFSDFLAFKMNYYSTIKILNQKLKTLKIFILSNFEKKNLVIIQHYLKQEFYEQFMIHEKSQTSRMSENSYWLQTKSKVERFNRLELHFKNSPLYSVDF